MYDAPMKAILLGGMCVLCLCVEGAESNKSSAPDVPLRINAASVSNFISASQQVTVVGTLLLESEPGYLFVHDESGNLRVHLRGTNSVKRGDLIEVTGLPILSDERP